MKNQYKILAIIAAGILVGCNSQKNANSNTHDGSENHSHDNETVSNNSTNYFGAYELEDANYGTKTKVSIKGDARVMVTNSLPNHKTGDFPNQGNPNTISSQNKTYTFPLHPEYSGKAQWIREPGVALNGIKFEPGTAEVVACDTGENYRVEAFQNLIDLGLDFNHAHVQPTGAYHYHGSPTAAIKQFDTGEDLVHIGFAHDGFPMYYSKSGKYKPSYKAVDGDREGEDCTYKNPKHTINVAVGGHHDGTFTSDFEFVEGFGDLDECNGITINNQYMYLVTNVFPYVSRCLMGEVEREERQGPPRGQQQGRTNERRPQGERPSAAHLIKQLDTNKDGKLSKAEVEGPLQENFSTVDTNSDGFLSKEELEKGARGHRQKR
ncbi:YHYH protein [Lacinutrix chionoecetis]